jgi:hypothetical protein
VYIEGAFFKRKNCKILFYWEKVLLRERIYIKRRRNEKGEKD